MKISDFEARFKAFLETPDTSVADAPAFLEEVRKDYTSMEAMANHTAELEAKVKDLQEANVKLFLATTSEAGEEEPEEKTGDDFIDEVFDNLLKEEE